MQGVVPMECDGDNSQDRIHHKKRDKGSSAQPLSSFSTAQTATTTTTTSVLLSHLELLGQDTLNCIMSYMYLDELAVLALVSHRLHRSISDTTHLYMCDSPMSRSSVRTQQPSQVSSSSSSSLSTHSSSSSSQQRSERRMAVPESHMSEKGLRKLLQRFQSLNVLHLHGLAAVGDNLFSILNQSPTAGKLHRISLHGCCLSYWCPTKLELENLTHVTISGGSIRVDFGSFIASSSSQLKALSIGQCSSLRDDKVSDMSHKLQHQLEELSLHQCLRVKKPVLQFSKLTRLNLMGCFALADMPRFDCPSLETLVLSFCFQLDGRIIQNVVDSLHNIRNLSLVKCPGMTRLRLQNYRHLETLNVSLSNNLQRLDLSGCHKLKVLEVSTYCYYRVFVVLYRLFYLALWSLCRRSALPNSTTTAHGTVFSVLFPILLTFMILQIYIYLHHTHRRHHVHHSNRCQYYNPTPLSPSTYPCCHYDS